jgi:hypothetical protein
MGWNSQPNGRAIAVATKEPRLGGASITKRPIFRGRKLSRAARAMIPPMLCVTRWMLSMEGSESSSRNVSVNFRACTRIEHRMFR